MRAHWVNKERWAKTTKIYRRNIDTIEFLCSSSFSFSALSLFTCLSSSFFCCIAALNNIGCSCEIKSRFHYDHEDIYSWSSYVFYSHQPKRDLKMYNMKVPLKQGPFLMAITVWAWIIMIKNGSTILNMQTQSRLWF